MCVTDYVTSDPLTVSVNTPISKVDNLLKRHQIRQVPVVNSGRHLFGIVTDRDIWTAVGLDTEVIGHHLADEIMSIDVITVAPSVDLTLAVDFLDRQEFGRCPSRRTKRLWESSPSGICFRRLCHALLSIARSSHAIFLGRGADLILPRLSNGLRVQITARHDYCVHAYAKEHGIGIDQAIDEIQKVEVERIRFFRHHFRTESGNQTRHDLIINIERFTIPQAVDLILSALALRDMMPESAPSAAEFIHHDRENTT